ncbi:tyrosine-protein kinase [Elysia marginata]|uniref:Tyrosine-protein kinase n=1 Tax=Elysia marginata TaxID=1093978 RepID=A0AAV4GQ32_9GAST|nr:tyrosine-protein kinase [Elysia marginata]
MARPHSNTNLKEKLQEEFLSCKICLEPLRRPKALPCLHSFCELCLSDYVRRNPGNQPGYFPCPMCRKSWQVPAGGVEYFPDNFLLLSLADTIHETTSSSSCPITTAPGDSWCRGSGLGRLSSSLHHQQHHHNTTTLSTNSSNFHAGGGNVSPSHYGPGRFVAAHNTSIGSSSGSLHLGDVSVSSVPSHYGTGGFVPGHHAATSGSNSSFTELMQQQVQLPPPRSHTLSSSSSTSSTLSSLSALSTSSLVSSAPPSPSPVPPRSLYPPSPREQRHRSHEWYFGKVSRNASEEWLLAPDYPKGTFLVRLGEMSPDTYTLSVRDCDELRGYLVKHYKILTKKLENGGELYFISNQRLFTSLSDLVKHYQESADGLCCKLASTCAKPRSLIWAMERGKDDEFMTDRSTLQLIRRLGSGQFAEVWLAKWQGSMDVAVKVQNTTCVTAAAFLDEAQILKTLQHPNIIELRGVCCNEDCDYSLGAGMSSDDSSGGGCGPPPPLLAQPQPVYLLTEYMPRGQLSRYLRDCGSSLALSQLIHIGAQIADAMAYMEKEKFVHRNLGARNILVGEQNRVKVAGFGMTKAMDDPDFNFRRGLKMAIKWMAPEVLQYNKYSTKADVWSFGIVLMEIFTFGKEPYEDKASMEAFESVQDGYRMEKPDICPPEVYTVMLSCWQSNAHSRPCFDFLNTFLHDFES